MEPNTTAQNQNQQNQNIDDASVFTRHDEPEKTILKSVWVGGGGNNAVNHMYREGIKNVSFVNINSDSQALRNSPVPTTLKIGDGLGAGNKPEKARAFAEDATEDIGRLFDDDTKMVFVTAGMGGGTGTGAGPVVARVAKERGLLTIGIVTIPFLFEGQLKIKKALAGADEMAKYVDALLVINNERLNEIYGDLQFDSAFEKADDTLSIAARSISELITGHGKINLDFNDVDTTLRDGGAAIISTGYGEGAGRVTAAIQDALNSPLLRNRDIMGSKKLLFCIFYNPNADDKFLMSESHELTNFISSINEEVDIIWGLGHDDTLGNKVKITILASGFDITLQDDNRNDTTSRDFPSKVFTPAAAPQPDKQPDKAPEVVAKAPSAPAPEIPAKRLTEEYGQEKISTLTSSKERSSVIILGMNQMDDDMICDILEKYPAYKRDRAVMDRVRAGAYNTQANRPGTAFPGTGKTVSFVP
ncbi:MAG: cell division FtsZ family protein [Duncaniella sp.]|nr:cell division FtsZ family protein [Duncaniella sp.]